VGEEIFNVGDARLNHTLADVADLIRDVIPKVRVEYVDNFDQRNYRVNFDKILTRVGFQARYTLRDGVREIAKALDERLITNYKDLRYHNQLYLQAIGSPGYKAEEDAMVMQAFSNQHQNHTEIVVPEAVSNGGHATLVSETY
jgi:translation initiation factor 2 alpha subunit (eIF-2alpha)